MRAADRESSRLVANRHLHYLPSTHICCPNNRNHPPSATRRQTRVIALLDSCVGVKFPCSSRRNQIVQNDLNAREISSRGGNKRRAHQMYTTRRRHTGLHATSFHHESILGETLKACDHLQPKGTATLTYTLSFSWRFSSIAFTNCSFERKKKKTSMIA